jgi:hypothetical protein
MRCVVLFEERLTLGLGEATSKEVGLETVNLIVSGMSDRLFGYMFEKW